MANCPKTKNACKICLQQVTTKTGLQCQGECRTWMHFNCLNYTPGKIRDIKAGLIKVTCPCPDCKSLSQKEYRTEKLPSNCKHSECPANQYPMCNNESCPISELKDPICKPQNSQLQLSTGNGCVVKKFEQDDNACCTITINLFK